MKQTLTDPTLSAEFDAARRYLETAKGYVQQGAGFMLLAGVELRRLKKLHGVQRGGDRRSNTSSLGLIGWDKLCEQELGISDTTANKYIAMAESAGQRVKILQELEEKLLTTPLLSLPAAAQEKVTKAVSKLCDGRTGKEVMQALGIATHDAGANLEKSRNKGGNSTKRKITEEEEAQEHFRPALLTLMGLRLDSVDKWERLLHFLPLDREGEQSVNDTLSLVDAEEELRLWLEAVSAARKRLAKALHGSRKEGAKERLAEAREKALSETTND